MPYSRAELIKAFRDENPDAASIPDNKIFAAIAVEDPELAKGISELQGGNPQGKATPVPWYVGLFNQGNPSSPTSQGLEEAANRTERMGSSITNTAPGALTGNEPTNIPGPFPHALDFVRNSLGSAVPAGPAGIMRSVRNPSGVTVAEALRSSPGVEAVRSVVPSSITNLPRAVAEALTSPEKLKAAADANRAAYEAAPSIIDTVKLNQPLSVLRAANTATLPARTSLQEKLAGWMAQGQPIGAEEVAADEASRIASVPPMPKEPLTESPKLNIPRPGVPQHVENQLEMARQAETPQQAFDRLKGQRDADLPPSQLSTGGPINAERPGPPSFLPQDLEAFQAANGGKLTSADVNKWMNVPAKEVLHGSNPGKQLMDEGLLGATKEATKANVDAALEEVGQRMESQLKAATAKGITIDAQTPVYDAVASATKKIGTPRDSTFQAQMNGIVDDIESKYPDLNKLTPSDTHKLKVELGDAISWSGARYDEPANQALIQIYRKLNAAIKDGVEGIERTQSRWGNLYAASKNLKNSLARDTVGTGTGLQPTPKVK